jgi:hypothetical protein
VTSLAPKDSKEISIKFMGPIKLRGGQEEITKRAKASTVLASWVRGTGEDLRRAMILKT